MTAQDAFGNTVSGFNAATNNVTIAPTGALSGGTISGLSGGNRLTSAGNFVSGVATLTTLVYTGPSGTGTFTATAATGGEWDLGRCDDPPGERGGHRGEAGAQRSGGPDGGDRAKPDDLGDGCQRGGGDGLYGRQDR